MGTSRTCIRIGRLRQMALLGGLAAAASLVLGLGAPATAQALSCTDSHPHSGFGFHCDAAFTKFEVRTQGAVVAKGMRVPGFTCAIPPEMVENSQTYELEEVPGRTPSSTFTCSGTAAAGQTVTGSLTGATKTDHAPPTGCVTGSVTVSSTAGSTRTTIRESLSICFPAVHRYNGGKKHKKRHHKIRRK